MLRVSRQRVSGVCLDLVDCLQVAFAWVPGSSDLFRDCLRVILEVQSLVHPNAQVFHWFLLLVLVPVLQRLRCRRLRLLVPLVHQDLELVSRRDSHPMKDHVLRLVVV